MFRRLSPGPLQRGCARLTSALAATGALAGAAGAQAFNLDVGDSTNVGVPSTAYGAAAGQAGVWNQIDGDPPYQFTLVDLAGATSAVQVECISTGGAGDFYFNNAITQGDDELLVDDCQDVGSTATSAVWVFSNLQDGPYHVYTYSIAPDNHQYRTFVRPEGTTDDQVTGGVFPGGHALGVSYALHCVDVTNGELRMELVAAIGFATCNGFQLVPVGSVCDPVPGAIVCDCSGVGSAPCGNQGLTDRGCENSLGNGGALLTATGTTAPDTVELHVVDAAVSKPGLFFQGETLVNGGAGALFGDGLRCAGTNIRRLEIRVTDGAGAASTTVSVSAAGGVAPGDGARYYQFWYRDPSGGPCGLAFNLSNGYEIVW